MCGYCGFSGFENRNNRRNRTQNIIMPLCVIKTGALVFREKVCWNGFLRTFEEG